MGVEQPHGEILESCKLEAWRERPKVRWSKWRYLASCLDIIGFRCGVKVKTTFRGQGCPLAVPNGQSCPPVDPDMGTAHFSVI